ncbi:hypothetical protein [Hymenobacter sp. BT730]|uniref:hypothetical protein n=1 Tax=Hymenobacter sp. BT730 TaxID=3063332 RepID=UPI0026DF2E3A|nr:hypothetical protein [Hymenobacter sp. BT730]
MSAYFSYSTTRDAALLALRPSIAGIPIATPAQTVGEFLHLALRPILKLQNELLLQTVADFIQDHHIPLAAQSLVEKQNTVAELLTRNTKLRYTVIGLVLAMFTSTEMAFYRQHRPELNRRLLELATRRVQDQTDILGAETSTL